MRNERLSSPASSSGNSPETGTLHFPYLDGLRGLAALYVACYHLTQPYYHRVQPGWQQFALSWWQFGGWAVDVFIVLSGYCLMLPFTREGRFPASTSSLEKRQFLGRFFKRRARRIGPPYYAALLFSLLLSSFSWKRGWIGVTATPGDLLMHALLIHNWFPQYAISLNPVLWTIATEWQIYFAFALVLLPLYRRYGPVALLLLTIFVGYLPMAFFSWAEVVYARPWYIALFAMGMVGAAAINSTQDETGRLSSPMKWLGGACLFALGTALVYNFVSTRYVAVDPFVGATTSCILVLFSRGHLAPLRLFLSRRACVRLGSFSYSLYLVHSPCQQQIGGLLRHFFPQNPHSLLVECLVGLPLTLLVAYVFSLLFERPFLRKPTPKPQSQMPI